MAKINKLTGVCVLSCTFMLTTIGDISQLRGDLFGTALWMLAAAPGGMWLMAQFLGTLHWMRDRR